MCPGVRQLASSLFTVELPARSPQDQTREAASRKQIVFYDLGSGVGRLTAQICLDHLHSAHLSIGKLVGVELSGARHDIAARARDHLFRVSDGCGGAIQYRHSDAQLVDFSDATHLYIASLCFPASVVAAIAERIRTGHAPDLQVRLAHCLDCGVTVVPNRKASHTEGSQQSARSAALCV